MALYASDEDEIRFAPDADPKGSYRCLECRGPVRVRRSRTRFPHFYHIGRSPSCRLYSKSEDHLVVQLALQKELGGSARLEQRVPGIQRISDLLWEKERIAFEIQCSILDPAEADKRTADYAEAGYRIVWLLDDRIFNKRRVRPAETVLREHPCYYFSFRRAASPFFYDQLEIVIGERRLKKSRPLAVNLTEPRVKPFIEWPEALPSQALGRIEKSSFYFPGDLIEKAIRSVANPWEAAYLAKWKRWEIELGSLHRPEPKVIAHFKWNVLRPFDGWLDSLVSITNE